MLNTNDMEIKITSFKYPILPFIIIFFVGIPVAMFGRLQIIEQTHNFGLGNLVFATIFIIWFFTYFAIIDVTYHLMDSFRNKCNVFYQNNSVHNINNDVANNWIY